MTVTCATCHEPMHGNRRGDCAECRAWLAYYTSLTPAEWVDELRAMAQYVDECDGTQTRARQSRSYALIDPATRERPA
jgi:hypothetical protein